MHGWDNVSAQMGLVVLPWFYATLSKRLSRFITAVPEFCLFPFVNGLFNIEKDIFWSQGGGGGPSCAGFMAEASSEYKILSFAISQSTLVGGQIKCPDFVCKDY